MLKFLLKRVDPRISSELLRHQRLILKGLAFSGGAALVVGALPLFVNAVLTAVQVKDPGRLVALSGAVIVLFTIKYFLTRGQLVTLAEATSRLTTDLRVRLFEKLQRLPIGYYQERKIGAIQSTLTNDVNVFQSSIGVVRDSIDGPIKVITGAAIVFALQWQLALAAMVVTPAIVLVIQRNSRKLRAAQAQVQHDLSQLSAAMQESMQGARVVQAFGAESATAKRFENLAEASFRSQMVAARRIAKLRPSVELIGAVSLAIVTMIVAYLVSRGGLGVPQLGAFLFALDTINQGMKSLGNLNQTLSQITAATDRIYSEVLDVPEPLADGPDSRELPNPVGRVEFRNVTFEYPDGTPALKNVSFSIEPGSSLALVGPSGAGKSTIADLLLRFYDPTEGQVLFDGVDVRELKVSWLRSQMAVVPQQTFLFAGTVAENVRMGKVEASDEEVWQAAKAAHAEPFLRELPAQIQTELGERGAGLSGGEAQRVAIARAVVRQPRVLVLDEATSNLDALSEKSVQEALEEIMQGRTTLFIAHRLSTAARADRVLMLRSGEVLELGSHKELMDRDGAYATMYRAFTSGVLAEEVL